ncbi:MAG: hypothetical protein ABF904_04590, partial [Ethanoligenens sp.]
KYSPNPPYDRSRRPNPPARGAQHPPAALPPGHRCFGCAAYQNGCAGVCYRELIITPKRKEPEKCDL